MYYIYPVVLLIACCIYAPAKELVCHTMLPSVINPSVVLIFLFSCDFREETGPVSHLILT